MALPATDDFEGSGSVVELTTYSSNWTRSNGTIAVHPLGYIYSSAVNQHQYPWNADSFDADQYSEVVVKTPGSGAGWVGAGTRMASLTGYGFYADYTDMRLLRFTGAGAASILSSSTTNSIAGNTHRIESEGSTHTCYIEGSTTGAPSAQTDATYASANPAGLCGSGLATTISVESWAAGNLGGAAVGGVFPPPIRAHIHNLRR